MNYNNVLDNERRINYLVRDLTPILLVGLTCWWDPAPFLSLMMGCAVGLLTIGCISATVHPSTR